MSINRDEVILDIRPFLMPMAIVISSLFFSLALVASAKITADAGGLVQVTTSGTGTTTTATDTTTPSTGDVSATQEQIDALFADSGSLVFGDRNSKLKLAMFSDPSCPYCHIAAGLNPELNSSAGTQFTLVADGGTYVAPVEEFRKLVDEGKAAFAFYYTNGHGNGELGAKAMYCANEQGKFWNVHDMLMTAAGYDLLNNTVKNSISNSATLADYLAPAIDRSFMQSCLESDKYASRLSSDQQVAASVGVSGTPGFYVNTVKFGGAYSYTDMKASVDAILAQ